MDTATIAHGVAVVCANQSLIVTIAAAALPLVGVSSIASFWANKMPPWLRVVVQGCALNLLHTVANPPAAAPQPGEPK